MTDEDVLLMRVRFGVAILGEVRRSRTLEAHDAIHSAETAISKLMSMYMNLVKMRDKYEKEVKP